jgi:hypothetical protein
MSFCANLLRLDLKKIDSSVNFETKLWNGNLDFCLNILLDRLNLMLDFFRNLFEIIKKKRFSDFLRNPQIINSKKSLKIPKSDKNN